MGTTRRPAARPAPTLRVERRLLGEGHRAVACIDECGRGALAGPASVGVVVVDATTGRMPTGLRDSKLLSASARRDLVPRVERWAVASAVGHAGAAEVDEVGINAALRLAAIRALRTLEVDVDVVLLDGIHDWLSAPTQPALFDPPVPAAVSVPVVTQVKGDLRCAGVAAASVLAKVTRDGMMVDVAASHPGYGFERNKGYSSPDHLAALRRLGASDVHRRSWQLPGVAEATDGRAVPTPDPVTG